MALDMIFRGDKMEDNVDLGGNSLIWCQSIWSQRCDEDVDDVDSEEDVDLGGEEGDDGGEVGDDAKDSEGGEENTLAPEFKLLPHLNYFDFL